MPRQVSERELSIPAFVVSSEISDKKKVWSDIFDPRHRALHMPTLSAQNMADRTEKEKKRKREKDGSSKPSKRVAIVGEKNIKISLLESDKWAPVIGMFRKNTPILKLSLCKD